MIPETRKEVGCIKTVSNYIGGSEMQSHQKRELSPACGLN